jgi:4-amino-4-deoxy-L-arabinose transferase-like glycosyltransferase
MPAARKRKHAKAIPAVQPWILRAKAALDFLERRSRALALLLVLIGSVRIVSTYTVFNHVLDEPEHLACGMAWWEGRTSAQPTEHTPLARAAAALGPYLLGYRTPSQSGAPSHEFETAFNGLSILYRDHRYERNLALVRLGVLPFFWVACLVVYQWGKRYFGPGVAALAVLFFSFLPPVLAHAGVGTTDMALTAFLGAAFLTAVTWTENPTPRHALWFGAAGGLAILSKLSSLAFFPAAAGIALLWYIAAERPPAASLARAAWRRCPTLCLAGLAACLVVWAGYRFAVGRVNGILLPAPELYTAIQGVAKHNANGHWSYLLGRFSATGFWYFFPVVLAVKTPLGFLALAGAGVALVFRKRIAWPRAWLPVAFSAGILAVGMASRINIGVRHILPIYIGLSLAAAAAVLEAWRRLPAGRWLACAAAVAALWFAGSSLASHPDYLAYFNELAASEPEKVLVDSDLDWGQDIKRLGERLRELGAHSVFLATFTNAQFEAEHGFPITYQVVPTMPGPGWNAISVTPWKLSRLGTRMMGNVPLWPDRYKPAERVGKSILLYHFPEGR